MKITLAPKPFIIGTKCFTFLKNSNKMLQFCKPMQYSYVKGILVAMVLRWNNCNCFTCLICLIPNGIFRDTVANYMDISGQHHQNENFSIDPKLKLSFW